VPNIFECLEKLGEKYHLYLFGSLGDYLNHFLCLIKFNVVKIFSSHASFSELAKGIAIWVKIRFPSPTNLLAAPNAELLLTKYSFDYLKLRELAFPKNLDEGFQFWKVKLIFERKLPASTDSKFRIIFSHSKNFLLAFRESLLLLKIKSAGFIPSKASRQVDELIRLKISQSLFLRAYPLEARSYLLKHCTTFKR
jgi:hypothetical protein